jgi:hypothetical protein
MQEKVTQPELKRYIQLFGMNGVKNGKKRKKVGKGV